MDFFLYFIFIFIFQYPNLFDISNIISVIEITMFLTQTQGQALIGKLSRQNSVSYSRPFSRSKSALPKKFQKMSQTSTNLSSYLKKSVNIKKTLNLTDFTKQTSLINPQKKWNKIVDLYNMPMKGNQQQQKQLKLIRPGLAFYKLLANEELLNKYQLKINFPQTFIQLSGDVVMINTNKVTGQIECHKIQRQKYNATITDILLQHTQYLRSQKRKYKPHYDYRQNQHAPVIVTKISQDFDTQFEVDVESYKNFDERRTKPSSNKIVQRFIYPRSMQATILRVCYHRKQLGQQRQEYYAYRFQNVDNIFRVNKKNNQIFQTFKLQSTICATYDRQNKIQYCKLSNLKGLQKYIGPSKQLINFLERSQKIRINKIYIDYIIDLFDIPWLINLKQISYEENKSLDFRHYQASNSQSLHISGSYGICRLCSNQYLKKQLRQSISNKMLIQFLFHLKKRMNVTDYQNIDFVKDIIQTKTKNYITLQVCKLCYEIVAEQYKLIKEQQKLAKICNIEPQLQMMDSGVKPLNLPDKLKQWRLMLYFVGISNIPAEILKDHEEVQLKYRLGNNDLVQHSWGLRVSDKSNSNSFHGNFKVQLNIKKVKIHYFYSQTLDIDNFLKQTEVNFQLAGLNEQKIFAKGSSGTLSTFRRQFHNDLCLRQTSSVLLFYSNGKYCEMTIKVGLICDGVYQIPDNLSLVSLNKVYFAVNQFTNSNPIPRQWMQAFGVNQQISMSDSFSEQQKNTQDNFLQINMAKKNKQLKVRNKLSRKSLNLYR